MNKLKFSKLKHDTLEIAEATLSAFIEHDPESNIIINFGDGDYSFKGPVSVAKAWLIRLRVIADKKAEKKAKKDKDVNDIKTEETDKETTTKKSKTKKESVETTKSKTKKDTTSKSSKKSKEKDDKDTTDKKE